MEEYPTITIETFKELLNQILWSWEYPNYDLVKHEDGYELNKLFIKKDRATYKLEFWNLAPGVYEDVERFYEFLRSTKGE
jgi:hypothetical protein